MNDLIRIRTTAANSWRAIPEMADGTPIPGVTHCTVTIRPDEPVRAVVGLHPDIDLLAHPLINLSTLERAAEALGFALVPLPERNAE